ncbi:MAG: DUF996 domain-containing protein, partial [Candidatus Hodarchaeales archaeon]
MTIEMSKNLGGVGALLMVISPFLGSITALLGLIGLILVLIAIKRLSDHYNDGSIFNNALYGVIANIIGGIVFAAAIVVTAVGFLSDLGLELSTVWSDPAVLSAINWQAVN